jgi:hypothetical protein
VQFRPPILIQEIRPRRPRPRRPGKRWLAAQQTKEEEHTDHAHRPRAPAGSDSAIDPRWNAYGKGTVGDCVIPDDCQKKVEELTQTLGAPPEDLPWGYMKE